MIVLNKKIANVRGRMLFDSRGMPTIEAEIELNDGIVASYIAPSGASVGKYEAFEKRDGKDFFLGKSVLENVKIINNLIKKTLINLNIEDQQKIDDLLIDIDNTENKSNLGGNTTIAVSMAALKAAALSNKKPLWAYLSDSTHNKLPLPEVQILAGGLHARGSISIQDFLIIPNGSNDFLEALEWVYKVYRKASDELVQSGNYFGVGDEGGYWPNFESIEAALEFLTFVIEKAGFKPLSQISISLDIAANSFKKSNEYFLEKNKPTLSANLLLEKILNWIKLYPIISIEDPFAEEDIYYFSQLMSKKPDYCQIVGDDLVVTNEKLIKNAYEKKAINAALIKPNQVGTVSETLKAISITKSLGIANIISARSGDTEDSTISDLAVGWDIKQLKVGSFSRSERMAKWNQCLRIGEKLSKKNEMNNNGQLNWDKL